MPGRRKQKLSIAGNGGSSPTWNGSLSWKYIDRNDLKTLSLDISLWSRERFRKLMIGYIKLNMSAADIDARSVKWLDRTQAEQTTWDMFVQQPTKRHRCRLPLRLIGNGKK
jgi:hypothetical protein